MKKEVMNIYQNDDLAVKSDDVQEFHAHVIGGSGRNVREISWKIPISYRNCQIHNNKHKEWIGETTTKSVN